MSDDDLKAYIRDLDDRIVMRGGRSIFGERRNWRGDTHVTPASGPSYADGKRTYPNGTPLVEVIGVPARDLRKYPRRK